MGTLHGIGILLVKRALMLVHHDAVLMERLEAVAIKLLGKEAFTGTKRVSGIHQNQVILILHMADELQAVLIIAGHPRVFQSCRRLGQEHLADLHHPLVNLHQVNLFDILILGQLPDSTPITATDDQHPFGAGMHAHRYMGYHLMVDKLILLRQHQIAIKSQHPAKLLGLKNINPLKLTLLAKELLVNLNGKPHIRSMLFCKPEHASHSPFKTSELKIL